MLAIKCLQRNACNNQRIHCLTSSYKKNCWYHLSLTQTNHEILTLNSGSTQIRVGINFYFLINKYICHQGSIIKCGLKYKISKSSVCQRTLLSVQHEHFSNSGTFLSVEFSRLYNSFSS